MLGGLGSGGVFGTDLGKVHPSVVGQCIGPHLQRL